MVQHYVGDTVAIPDADRTSLFNMPRSPKKSNWSTVRKTWLFFFISTEPDFTMYNLSPGSPS
jgi:hypothetical protein